MDEQTSGPVRGECLCMGAGPQATSILKSFTLGPATDHFRTSRIEFLKGIRSLLDSRIEKLQRAEHVKGSNINVE